MTLFEWFCGLLGGVYALSLLHRLLKRTRAPFVTLHTSPRSARLARNAGESNLSLGELIAQQVPELTTAAKFDRAWWLPGGHLQTMYSSLGDFSKVDTVVYERKYLELPDGGILGLDITPPLSVQPISESENVLLVAHGLTGGSHESYVRAVLARIAQPALGDAPPSRRFRAVVLNFRGCNGSPVVTPRLYHAGSSDDVRHVVLWICHTFPSCSMYGLGFSLGANILTKYAGEEGEGCPLSGLVTLANPWDFVYGSHFLPSTLIGRHVYRWVLGGALRRLLHLHRRAFLDAPELSVPHSVLEDVFNRPSITLGQYDTIVTAPMYGFEDEQHYYRTISSIRVIPNIKIPCLSINSLDDPITGSGGLPIKEASEPRRTASPSTHFDISSFPSYIQAANSLYLVLAVTNGGGHLGWFEHGCGGRGVRRWYVKPVEQYLAALVGYGLARRPKPCATVLGADFARQEDRADVGFRELSREQSELLVSGAAESKLFTGW
ncbi:AB-hydrolase YheT [Epithele typhae]|uniref:AB-hydrolase YheT n=1 Tax=Epithele typhae TaxID=378194 RepID=UPI002007C659|nr:AB-hydrolase YheT [Epithele typhae]KAH9937799.1 AB-hydrolase YheT [Epithele typhae]